jgi:hypothetical protein
VPDLTPSDAGNPLARRTLLAVGVTGMAALGLAGCSDDDDGGGRSARATPARGVTPDVAVATAALGAIRATREAVVATQARYPATRAQLTALSRMHRAHEATLVDAVPDRARTSASPAPYAVPRRREAALRALRKREQHLHTSLDGLALRAQSGDFARLLASMGAAVDQRLAGWV